jgi:GntR family transcriptional repressor for pyruvate dehydrogenase complex
LGRVDIPVTRITPAYQQVAGQLRHLIATGELALGERLPNESALGELFGVSRSTVREALKGLLSEGVIATTRGVKGGSFITQPDPDHVAERLELSVGLLSAAEVVSVDDLLEARVALEVPAARFAADRRDDDNVERLKVCVAEEREISSGFDDRLRLHRLVLEAAGNPLLEIVARPVLQSLRTRFLRDRVGTAFWHDVHTDHIAIVDAIAEGDAAAAAIAMAEHLDRLRATYKAIDRLAEP